MFNTCDWLRYLQFTQQLISLRINFITFIKNENLAVSKFSKLFICNFFLLLICRFFFLVGKPIQLLICDELIVPQNRHLWRLYLTPTDCQYQIKSGRILRFLFHHILVFTIPLLKMFAFNVGWFHIVILLLLFTANISLLKTKFKWRL